MFYYASIDFVGYNYGNDIKGNLLKKRTFIVGKIYDFFIEEK